MANEDNGKAWLPKLALFSNVFDSTIDTKGARGGQQHGNLLLINNGNNITKLPFV